jgi:hypothetical protein
LTSARLGSVIKCPWNQVESALAINDNRYFAPAIKQILTGRSAFVGRNVDVKGAWQANAKPPRKFRQYRAAGRRRGRPGKAASESTGLSFPPEPFGMRLAPVRVTLLVLADQDAEAHTGFPVAFFAKLMEAEHFRLHVALGACGRCDHRCRGRDSDGDHDGRHQRLQGHIVSCSNAAPAKTMAGNVNAI